jgi:hypothetical protein
MIRSQFSGEIAAAKGEAVFEKLLKKSVRIITMLFQQIQLWFWKKNLWKAR